MENGIKERKKKVSVENKPVKQRQPKAEGVAEKEKTAVKPRKTVIKVEELYREYAKLSHGDEETESIKVLKGLDFVVKEQEFVGIMGKSGCGKTTLLKTLGLIDKPTKGNLYFCGKETRKLWNDELADIRRREIGFVFQDFYLMDSLSVSENIMLPMVLDKKNVRKCMEKGKEYAEHFGLSHLMKKYPYELSGGEKQRLALARLLLDRPEIVVLDEATSALDNVTESIVMKNVLEQAKDATVISIAHRLSSIRGFDHVFVFKEGRIVGSGTFEELLAGNSYFAQLYRKEKERGHGD